MRWSSKQFLSTDHILGLIQKTFQRGNTWLPPSRRWKEATCRFINIQGTIGCTPNSVPMVFIVFCRDSLGIITHKYQLYKAYIGISHKGYVEIGVHSTIPWNMQGGPLVLAHPVNHLGPHLDRTQPWGSTAGMCCFFAGRHASGPHFTLLIAPPSIHIIICIPKNPNSFLE